MSYTILYVDSTETLMGQGRKGIILRNGKSCRVSLSGSRSP